ncbi:MAG: DNA cytosine methyltransferase, partial [Blastochloris sp.]|nr:DNA cytosine methyltransferase [Blastochloris sp.]
PVVRARKFVAVSPDVKEGEPLAPAVHLFEKAVRMLHAIVVVACGVPFQPLFRQMEAAMAARGAGILDAVFADYRQQFVSQLHKLGYKTGWHVWNASDFGVPQLRPRVVFVAIEQELYEHFSWPVPTDAKPPTVGETLYDLMEARGWKGASSWRERANEIAPTIVGGSLKHGGPDLGPTRAKRAWSTLGVDGHGIWDEAPGPDFVGMPRLTVRMVARLQGFPDSWEFAGRKTPAYRQVGNAFPPPVAKAVARQILACLQTRRLYAVKAAG